VRSSTYRVDVERRNVKQVAREFLAGLGAAR
jgi:hypothetical protein